MSDTQKIQVSIDRVRELIDELAALNALPLESIEWTLGGVPMAIPPSPIREFRFTGLSNKDFVAYEFWLEPVTLWCGQCGGVPPEGGCPHGRYERAAGEPCGHAPGAADDVPTPEEVRDGIRALKAEGP